MSGKMKKLICAIISGTMILSSASMLAFAADPDQADTDNAEVTETVAPEAEATEAPTDATDAPAEATEAPAAEATEAPAAPVVTNTKYDDDAYYQKALSLCQGLGIITGREDGNVDPEANVTRAEMAAIILRMLANTTTSTYRDAFTDVTSSHWAASTIQTASSLGIINGYPEDGSFRPDNPVQYEQIAKMMVCAMNYQNTAEYYGGYPNGFLRVASDLGITKNAPGSTGVASERGVVIKMIYNALLADFNEPTGTEYGQQTYRAEKTLAEYAFDVKEGKGVLLGTEVTSLTSRKYNKGQVCINVVNEDRETEEEIFLTDLTGLEDLLASNITFYYEEPSGRGEKNLLAVVENTAKTKTENISREDIEDLDEFKGFDGSEGSIKLHGKSRFKISDAPTVIYNGSLVTEDNFKDAQTANTAQNDTRLFNIEVDSDGNKTATAKTFAEFLKPEVGTIRIVDNDTDGIYDIVFVDNYETMVVTSASTKSVIGKINNQSTTINVNEEENDLTITTTIAGMEAAPRNLKKNSVVSIKRSLDGETMEFVSTGESFTGAIQSIADEEDGMIITVGGQDYDVDANAESDCKTGVQATFYTDLFGRVGYVEATTSGMLQSGEKYGWIMSMYDSNNGEDTIVNLYSQDGKAVEATLADHVDFWASNAAASARTSADDVKKALATTSGSTVSIQPNAFLKMGDTQIRLVKYKTNASNEITRLYLAVNSANITDKNALRINPKNLNGAAAVGGSVAGYSILDGILEFSVPMQAEDMKSASNYEVGEVASSNYVVRETGASRDYVIGEFDGVSANIVIKFTASATAAAKFTDVDSSGNGPSVMVIDKISEGIDADDNQIYKISGNIGGSEVSVTTTKNSIFGDINGPLYNANGKNGLYAVTEKWQAPNPTGKLSDYLKKGDILLYTTDGRVLMRYASARDAKFDEEGNFIKSSIPMAGVIANTRWSARVAYFFDRVTETGLEDQAYVKLEGVNDYLSFSPDMTATLVTINGSTGDVKVEKEALESSEILEGDYLWINYVDKQSSVKAIIVYRFAD